MISGQILIEYILAVLLPQVEIHHVLSHLQIQIVSSAPSFPPAVLWELVVQKPSPEKIKSVVVPFSDELDIKVLALVLCRSFFLGRQSYFFLLVTFAKRTGGFDLEPVSQAFLVEDVGAELELDNVLA